MVDPVFPTDILAEIFGHLKEDYATFRLLDRKCSRKKILWDGWDAKIARGYSIEITNKEITWFKNGKIHSPSGSLNTLPATEYIDGSKLWYQNGNIERSGLPAIELSNGEKYYIENGRLQYAPQQNTIILTCSWMGNRLGVSIMDINHLVRMSDTTYGF